MTLNTKRKKKKMLKTGTDPKANMRRWRCVAVLKSWKVKYLSMELCSMVIWSPWIQNGNVQPIERDAFTLLSNFPLKDCRCSYASKYLKFLEYLKPRQKYTLWLIPLCQKKFKKISFLSLDCIKHHLLLQLRKQDKRVMIYEILHQNMTYFGEIQPS